MATLLSSIETQARRYLQEPATLATPATPVITNQGSAGATAYSYKVVAGHRQGTTEASSAGSTATGNVTLSSSNFNRITWTATTNATYYSIYRIVGGATQGLIGTVGATLQFDDTGLTGDATTAPTINTSGGAYWSSEELIDIIIKGAADLWGGVIDLNNEHFLTIDNTNVSMAANTVTLTGVPTDVFRIYLIEPRDLSNTSVTRNVVFVPADYNSSEFSSARSLAGQDMSGGGVIYYAVTSAGFPVSAPTIRVAPQVSSAINISLCYYPGLGTLTAASSNPIPGESDQALIAWCVAYAQAKQRDDNSPDPAWTAIYATEKLNILKRLSPRQNQEPEFAGAMWAEYW